MNEGNDANLQVKITRTIIAVTTIVVTVLGVGVAIGVYRAQIVNNSKEIKSICERVKINNTAVDKVEKEIIKIQGHVERTDERTGDIKEAIKRIEKKL